MNDPFDLEKLSPIPVSVNIPSRLGIFPLKETVVYPSVPAQLSGSRPQTVRLVREALEENLILGLVTTRAAVETPSARHLYRVGTAAAVQRMWHLPDGSIRLIVQGICRIAVERFFTSAPHLTARVKPLADRVEANRELKALARSASGLFQKIVSNLPQLPDELQIAATNIDAPGRLADFIAFHLNLNLPEKQALLEEVDVTSRLRRLTRLMTQELEVLELGTRIQSQVQLEMDKSRRDYLLREQIKVLQQELGEGDERTAEIGEIRERIHAAGMPAEALREADRELDRLSRMPVSAAEYTVCRTYLDWLVELPWSRATRDTVDLDRARRILDGDHTGLERAKERILDFLAVHRLKPDLRGPVLCLVGPPGVGKTTLGRSIARALGRNFVGVALGGLRDEAELRGHRRTYVGALPGRVIQGIHRAGSNNPVLMFDEVDKLGASFRGDPAAVLLEILDPEQNASFLDHYLNVPFDLSRVLFIVTANLLSEVPGALRDRLEILELPGYIDTEKVAIARKHLLPRQLKANGLTRNHLGLKSATVRRIVSDYTREAGLRNLEREIGAVCRKVARQVAEGKDRKVIIAPPDLISYLGPPRFFSEVRERRHEPGVATGLAATPAGGQIFTVESTAMAGDRSLILTGHLGEIMKESALAALSYIRTHSQTLNIDEGRFASLDIHIHVPAGAVPKDGPSAGIAIAVSVASLLSGRPARSDLALTGEITLRGRVLPVGGVKDKVLAAHRTGIRRVILPDQNRPDLEEIPTPVLQRMRFEFVRTVGQVFDLALCPPPRKSRRDR